MNENETLEKWIAELLVSVAELVQEYTKEQQRYVLAKEIFLRRVTHYTLTTIDDDLKQSVEWADRLIAELQKGK